MKHPREVDLYLQPCQLRFLEQPIQSRVGETCLTVASSDVGVNATMKILDGLKAGRPAPVVEEGDPLELIRDAAPGEYVALMIFGDPTDALLAAVGEFRRTLQDAVGLATTFGLGPRFLHSTGQLHKGGPENGLFLQMVVPEEDLPIPGRGFGFQTLMAAQAAGDLDALRQAGRRAVRFGGGDPVRALRGRELGGDPERVAAP